MSKHSGTGIFSWITRSHRAKKPSDLRKRRLAIESLELRRLLTSAPTSIVFQPPTGQTAALTSENNSSSTTALQFLVSGVTAGDTVEVFADGPTGSAYIGNASVPTNSTSVTVTTSGSDTLADGNYTFTAVQVDTTNTPSAPSPATPQVQIFAGLGLTQTTASATVGQAFTFTAVANAPSGDTATITAGSTLLSGMTFANNTFSGWTPTAAEAGTTQSFTVNLTDTLGNSTTATVFVAVAPTSAISVVAPPSDVAAGSPVLVAFNDSSGSATTTYHVTTSSTSDPTGADLTATVMPSTNPVLQIATNEGTMDFELLQNYAPNTVAQIENLVNSGAYNPSNYTDLSGTFELGISTSSGTVETGAITFQQTNLKATAASIQSALVALGLTGTTVTVDSNSGTSNFVFDVTLPDSLSPLEYVAGSTPLPVSFSNSTSVAATTQTLTFVAPTPDFYRIIDTFVDQGGISGLGNVAPIPVELNPDLRFTSSGLLAMANNGVDGNSSEFFISNPDDMSDGFLDFRYTIFGKLISGDAVRQAIAASQVGPNSGGEDSAPFETPKIESMSITTMTTGGVLLLKASPGAQGPYTVTISDGTNTQTFQIQIGATGPFELSVGTGSSSTSQIGFDSSNPTTTAANMQSALVAAGFTGTTVSVDPGSTATSLKFDVTFPSSEPPITATTSTLPVTFSNSVTTSAATQVLTFNVSNSGAYDPPNPWVKPINGTDKISTSYNTPASFTPAGESANGSAVQVNVQVMSPLEYEGTAIGGYADSSFANFPSSNGYTVGSPSVTLAHNGSSYTVTPSPGFYGMQVLEVTAQSATPAAWDSAAGVNPVYQAFVPVYVGPPAPTITSILAGGQPVNTDTFDNNSSTATEFTFNISGVVSGATVSVYMDGGATPLVSGTAGTGATLTLTTDGSTKIPDGAHTFTVKQSVASGAVTSYANWSSSGPATSFPIESTTIASAASAGETITIGLFVLAQPVDEARANALYTYTVQTNAPAGDSVTVAPVELPPGMTFNGSTFSWTPSTSQLNTSPTFEATVTDSQGRTVTIGPLGITVVVGLTPTPVPVNSSSGGNVTVTFSGDSVKVYDNIGKTVLSNQTFKSTDTVEIDLPALQANTVVIDLPKSGAAAPREVYVNGSAQSLGNQVTINGNAGADNYAVAGNTVTANGMQVVDSAVQRLTLVGMGGDNDYVLTSSAVPLTIDNDGSQGTLDFSHDAAGVAVNLGLDKGQAQTMAGWSTTLAINGVLNEIIGTRYADTLIGGPAAVTIIHAGAGNDTLVGGSGNSILVGGGGSDTITGGSGRNLLIAGSGQSTIYDKGALNMVFGGTLNVDANDQALMDILNQGPNFMHTYAMREAQARAARNPALKADLPAFQDSGVHDTIVGDGPNDLYVLGKYDSVRQ